MTGAFKTRKCCHNISITVSVVASGSFEHRDSEMMSFERACHLTSADLS